MIIIIHKNEHVVSVKKLLKNEEYILSEYIDKNVCEVFFALAQENTDESIAWCEESLLEYVDFNEVEKTLLSELEILSFHPNEESVFNEVLGYANFFSTTISSIPKNIKYQTWIMSESVGITSASVINKFTSLNKQFSFQITLNAMCRLGSALGLLHYSEPSLYKGKMIHGKQESYTETLQFIKLFQKRKWLYYIGLLNFLKKENHFIDILKVFFTKSPSFEIEGFEDLYSKLVKVEVEKSDTLDVLIPTLGRKKYLKDVLDDLAKQTHLPKNVIIVEQHPDENMDTELDYIKNESWPFVIKHTFIHKLGACNARNIGLDMIESKWLFMADDDIRITDKTIENTLSFMKSINVPSVSIGTYLPSQDKKALGAQAILWEAYSTCTTILASKYAKQVRFDMAYEFGYGEDTAYGRELRNIGCPTLYTPVNALLHLKAPIGGFRYQFPHPWLKDDIQPKPSPTMMYLYQSYMSKSQLFAYKVFLFLSQSINRKKINIFKYKKQFQKQWERSEYWADEYRKTEK